MSLAGAGHVQQRLPLSPQSPQTRSFAPSTYVSRHPLAPTSPPTSSSTSVNGSDSASPQHIIFSPPSSVAMSAQTSQTSLTSNASFARDAIKQEPATHVANVTPLVPANESSSPALIGSAKRKFEEDDETATTPTNKRPKNGDCASREETEHLDASAIAREKAQVLGPFYKVCQQPHPSSRPHASQDLISLFGLNGLAAGVARKDPMTGEKINKLRKSYENQIKDIPGRNKATTSGSNFLDMLYYPDEEWQVQRVAGKDVTQGLGDEIMSKLEMAVQGDGSKLPVAEHDRWKSMIALDEPPIKVVGPPTLPHTAVHATHPANMGYTTMEPSRTSRRGTKRRYDDESFEGYGEGFVDDSAALHAAEEHDELVPEPGVKRKKRRVGAAGGRRR